MLSFVQCRKRQQRLLPLLQQLKLDAAALAAARHVLPRGIRIENEYIVTADGAQNLVEFPMELVSAEIARAFA